MVSALNAKVMAERSMTLLISGPARAQHRMQPAVRPPR